MIEFVVVFVKIVTKRPCSLYNNDNLQLSAQGCPCSTKRPKLSLRARPALKPRRVSPPGRKKKSIIFSEATCAAEKNTARPANVRAGRPGRTARAPVQAAKPAVKEYFLTGLQKRQAFASGAHWFTGYGHPAGQCVGDRVHDFLCLFFAAALKDVGGEVEADMDGSSEFGHVTLPLSSDFRRRLTQRTAPDGWYCRLQAIL